MEGFKFTHTFLAFSPELGLSTISLLIFGGNHFIIPAMVILSTMLKMQNHMVNAYGTVHRAVKTGDKIVARAT